MEQADKGCLRSVASSLPPTLLFDSSRDLPVGLVKVKVFFFLKGQPDFPSTFSEG